MKTIDIKEQITGIVSRVVGVIGFSSLNFDEPATTLENDFDKGIEININENQVSIKIALIILSSVSVKGLADEISQRIIYRLEKQKMSLQNLNIFIRGIE
ncbi:Asp23/Gls24 family envelope stress response protein [Mycoplasma sp. 128]